MREARVSNVELYRMWAAEEGLDVSWLLTKLTSDQPTEKMLKGTAFHKALELATPEDCYTIRALDYTFHMLCDVDIVPPPLRELKLWKQYGDLMVSGTLDGLDGTTVIDYKTTETFDADQYMESLQWRFYLDLSGAHKFDWHIFRMSERGEKEYEVFEYHKLTQYRYADLHADCLKAAHNYSRFAEAFLEPSKSPVTPRD